MPGKNPNIRSHSVCRTCFPGGASAPDQIALCGAPTLGALAITEMGQSGVASCRECSRLMRDHRALRCTHDPSRYPRT